MPYYYYYYYYYHYHYYYYYYYYYFFFCIRALSKTGYRVTPCETADEAARLTAPRSPPCSSVPQPAPLAASSQRLSRRGDPR